MHIVSFTFPLMACPRPKVSRTNGIYYPNNYREYQLALVKHYKRSLSHLSDPINYPYYCGLFNGYVSRYRTSDNQDNDNIIKPLLDCLVAAGKLRGDRRHEWTGIKQKAYPMSQETSILLIGTELEESTIDQKIRDYCSSARLGLLTF